LLTAYYTNTPYIVCEILYWMGESYGLQQIMLKLIVGCTILSKVVKCATVNIRSIYHNGS
jgi:hypothetical protein